MDSRNYKLSHNPEHDSSSQVVSSKKRVIPINKHKMQNLLLFQFFTINIWHVVDSINFSLIIELSDQIRQKEDVQSMVIFSQKSFVSNLLGYEELLQHESGIVPLVLIGEDYEDNRKLVHIIGLRATILVFMDNVDNQKMFSIVNEALRQIHILKIVFILDTLPPDSQSLITFFEKCFGVGLINIIIMSDDHVLTYEPFPKVSIENITSTPVTEYYPDRCEDLKGYVFHTPILQDGARVFIYKDKDGNEKFTGTNAETFRLFVQRHNATFERLSDGANRTGFDIQDGLTLVRQGKVDILMHSYTSFSPRGVGFSYPVAQIQWQLIVPSVGEVSSYKYLILPFDSEVWLFIGVSFIYISIASYLSRWYCLHLKEYGPAFSTSLAQLLYLPSSDLSCNLRAVIFEMQIFCYGFVLTNLYLAFLSAFLTTSVQGTQIDSLDDLYESGVKLLSIIYEVGSLKEISGYKKHYLSMCVVQNIDFINEYRKSLNKTYALILASDRSRFFLGQQKYLEKKRMHVAQNTLGTYFLTFIGQIDSPFLIKFDVLLLHLDATGLFKKWEEDVFNQAVAAKYLQIFRTDGDDLFRPLTIAHLGMIWITLGVGIAVSMVVFLLETLRYRLSSRVNLQERL